MAHVAEQIHEEQESPEQILWRAVIASTVQEWLHGHLRRKREAEQFLFQDHEDYQMVCLSAGINPDSLRERLLRIRERVGSIGQLPSLRNQHASGN